MANTSPIFTSLYVPSQLEPLRAKSGWVIALGVVYLVTGFVALGSITTATAVTVFVVGIMMLIAGIAEVINAFQVKTWGGFFAWLLLGLLYIVAGFVTFENPVLAAVALTLLLGVALIASGIMRIALAIGMRGDSSWMWIAASGVLTLLLGVIILARWPVSGVFVLGLLLGIDLVVAGIGWITLGLHLRQRAIA